VLRCAEASITNWELNRVQPAIAFLPRIINFLGSNLTEQPSVDSLADRLQRQRHRLGLSRRKVAKLLGTDVSNLAGWERERHKPTKKSLALIAEFLSWTAAVLE
jgi:DNA-binding XRE family transcriptional regulator